MTSINNYNNYLIYNNGDIYSKKNKIFLKQRKDKKGYFRVDLVGDNKKRKTFKIHQLVGIAYLNHNLEDKEYVIDHIDSNKSNNYLHNLQRIHRIQNLRKKNVIKKNGLPRGIYCSGKHYYCLININGILLRFSKIKTLNKAIEKHNKIYLALMKNVKGI